MIETERQDSSTARVPAVSPGRAVVVTRYHEEKAVVLNPSDFHRLASIDAALDEIAAADAPVMTQLVLRAHRLEDEPGEPVEEPEAIKALLGL